MKAYPEDYNRLVVYVIEEYVRTLETFKPFGFNQMKITVRPADLGRARHLFQRCEAAVRRFHGERNDAWMREGIRHELIYVLRNEA